MTHTPDPRSASTAHLGLEKPVAGAYVSEWGALLNDNYDIIDAGVQAVATAAEAAAADALETPIAAAASAISAAQDDLAAIDDRLTALEGTGAGTAGQVLKSGGDGADPYWDDA